MITIEIIRVGAPKKFLEIARGTTYADFVREQSFSGYDLTLNGRNIPQTDPRMLEDGDRVIVGQTLKGN